MVIIKLLFESIVLKTKSVVHISTKRNIFTDFEKWKINTSEKTINFHKVGVK